MQWDESKAGKDDHEIASALLKWSEIIVANYTADQLII